jgi:hypothetical protein
MNLPEKHQECQSESAGHLNKLRSKQDVPATFAIGNDSAKKGKQEYRNLAAERVETEVNGGIGQAVDEPGLRDQLHPRSDARCAGAHPHQAEVAIMKSPEDTR